MRIKSYMPISMSLILLISSILTIVLSQNSTCKDYIDKLDQLFHHNKTQFQNQISGYAFLSGKALDDLGFSSECMENNAYQYFTVQIDVESFDFLYETYYGFCFTNLCTAQDLTKNGAKIVNDILQIDLLTNSTMVFRAPNFHNSASAIAIVLYVIFSLIIAASMLYSIRKWIKQCSQSSQPEDRYSIQFDQNFEIQQIPLTLQEKLSLQIKFYQILTPEQSLKVIEFSIFKLLSIPFLIYGQLFYLGNYATYNYFAFRAQIYQNFYAKLAVAAYYIPDIFFFISGYLFMGRFVSTPSGENAPQTIAHTVKNKFIRYYPLYIAIIFIYWIISPTLHSGPVWYVYQQQAQICDYAWWRVFFLIDNWFTNSCYPIAWFVQVQLQLVLLASIFIFFYLKKRKTSYMILAIILTILWILVFTISGPLPSSIQTTLSDKTQVYFKSTYSHAPFYFTGILFAIISSKPTINSFIQSNLIDRKVILTILQVVSFGFFILIILRPSVWVQVLGLQLAMCRVGIFICLLIFMLNGIFKRQSRKTVIHKIAQLSYPIILISGIVTMSAFWGFQSFSYLSGSTLITSLIASLSICIPVGAFLGLLFKYSKNEPRLQSKQ